MLQINIELGVFRITQFSQKRIHLNFAFAQPRFSSLDQFTGKSFLIKKKNLIISPGGGGDIFHDKKS